MNTQKRETAPDSSMDKKNGKDIWIISKGRYTELDMTRIAGGNVSGPVKEYLISYIARYMLDPKPIQVDKKLVGCKIEYHQKGLGKGRKIFAKILPKKIREVFKTGSTRPEILTIRKNNRAVVKDENLESHIKDIETILRPYDPMMKRLAALDPEAISDITGMYDDIGGGFSWLVINGSVEEKIQYMMNNVSQDVGVILKKAYMSDGLFEMKGFKFTSYDPEVSFRLIKFMRDGKSLACVLNSDNHIEFWIDDIKLIQYIQLLEQSIRTNPKFYEAFELCRQDDAKPLKILLNKKFDIDYSRANLPKVYKKVFDRYNMGLDEKNAIVNSINNLQMGISFNYIPQSSSIKEKLFTNICVMHDIKALEPIKEVLPQIYSEITKMVSVSEAGRYYLLDAIRGYASEQ